ncbi:RNHCP domain-containing protein [Candidatus Peregrinibacteria bacterium]|nr:RNHCP domain-containing protein [Candidatus Peregrinibacteria bacterium]
MRNFITINESFNCQNCGKKNPKAEKTCRNHCKYCLYSRHVDDETPGDRASTCKNLMEPIRTEKDNRKDMVIFHKCTKCGKIAKNKMASDDDMDLIIKLTCPEIVTKPQTKRR